VADNLLDLTVCLEVGERFPCKRAVDLQTIDEDGDGDEAVGLDILLELVVGLLVEDNGVVGLVLDCVAVSGDSLCVRSASAWKTRSVCEELRRIFMRLPAMASMLGEVLSVRGVVSRTLAL
jgi:hypothetical protein